MCGIVGIISNKTKIVKSQIDPMLAAIVHRGPEDSGVWFGTNGRVAFGHCRLAIIDLSPGGHQPRTSADGRFTITFNGEIYNYAAIKEELRGLGYTFVTQSDTEVLLYAFVAWKENCLKKINGMFAFAIWDEAEQSLFAARDYLGEKPLKYFSDGERIIFASETKAIFSADPVISREADWQAIDEALTFRFVPAPATGFKAIKKLPAGHYLRWQNGKVEVVQYWKPEAITVDLSISFEDAKEQVWKLFKDSVRLRLISDVPVGAFLSGGLDSSSVVAAMAELQKRPVETFVISLEGESADQRYARKVAAHFGTNHHELALSATDYASALENLISHYDEPFFDQSALPSLLINQEMKKHVTVALSGDGADELFGGYDAYRFARFLNNYQKLPALVRKKIIPAVTSISKSAKYRAEVLAKDFFSAYTEYFATWKTSLPVSKKYLTKTDLYLPQTMARLNLKATTNHMRSWFASESSDVVNNAMLADIKGRLADCYLPKIDFAAMASAVEVRPPFLDQRLVEYSLRLPSSYKINGRTSKYIWREAIASHLPTDVLRRPKAGFAIPLHEILIKQLRPLIEDVVLSANSPLANVFSSAVINRLWMDHIAKKADYSNHLWSLLVLALWIKKYQVK